MTRWIRRRGATVLYDDDEAHVGLILRTLRLDEDTWSSVLDEYAARLPDDAGAAARLLTLGEAYRLRVRRSAPCRYDRCRRCGHGRLIDPPPPDDLYRSAAYYQRRDHHGVGYEGYLEERPYREEKGARLLARLQARRGQRLLEVGSGYGFTRAAAERLGVATAGVDLNPHAVAQARELYGFETFCGTLGEAPELRRGGFQIVLYQFVLEHLADPTVELRLAREALAPDGVLALLVPSMDALEIEIFGGDYRSFRPDHLHVFSRRSIGLCLARVGFRLRLVESGCSLHLLRGFVGQSWLQAVYDEGRGPDLLVIADI